MKEVCYTRYQVSFYLRWIGSLLKYYKVPKYYDHDCRHKTVPSPLDLTRILKSCHERNDRIKFPEKEEPIPCKVR